MWRICQFVLYAGFAASLWAQQSNASAILKHVGVTYRSVPQYRLTAHFSSKDGKSSGQMTMAFKVPNRYRLETVTASGPQMLIVNDGSTVWMYAASNNQYLAFPANELAGDNGGASDDVKPESMNSLMLFRYREAADLAPHANFLRQETIMFKGAQIRCYVISLDTDTGNYTWWIDAENYHILREDTETSTTVFQTIDLGGNVADDLFRFTPPTNAKKLNNPQ